VRKTYSAKAEDIERTWYVVDAEGKTLGRLATEVARISRGKHKPIYTPHVDTGDYVIIVNADKVRVTGKRLDQKKYYRHSGYMGGLKETTLRTMLDKHPERVLQLAVKGMMPKNRLGRAVIKKLKVYATPDHPHAAQKPQPMEL